ncbi:hypothetical protein VTI74DRAFT_5396 [Chaetomium olivicolor]
MSSQQIVLFDLPSKDPCSCWSLNPWKTRLLLNYKGLDYRTEWVEYPDIKPRLEAHVPPHDATYYTSYTIPAVLLPSGKYIMDSRQIANHLESVYPNPPLHLDSPVLAKLEEIMTRLLPLLRPVYLPRVPRNILNERSRPYWMETRLKMTGGIPLDEFERANPAEGAYDAAAPLVREVTGWLKENGEGPFFLGAEVSYADFVWGGFLIFLERVGEGALEKVLERSGDAEVHRRLLSGIERWSKRADH